MVVPNLALGGLCKARPWSTSSADQEASSEMNVWCSQVQKFSHDLVSYIMSSQQEIQAVMEVHDYKERPKFPTKSTPTEASVCKAISLEDV